MLRVWHLQDVLYSCYFTAVHLGGGGACNEMNMLKQEHVYLCLQSGTTTSGDVDTRRHPDTLVLFGFVF